MDLNGYIGYLKENNIGCAQNVSMKSRTTMKTGGVADLVVFPASENAAADVIRAAVRFGVPYFITGNGSNILVSDKGIEGAVIDMCGVGGVEISGDTLVCGAGESLRRVCIAARDAALSGLEFAYGIPGTVGGAFYMNAGAYGGEIADVAVSAVCLDKNMNICETEKADMAFGYRTSLFKTEGLIILSVKIKLSKGDKAAITDKMNDIFARRQDKQPLNFPSAGSTFKRPAGHYAGTLIEQAGLKGKSVGGAAVSEKHAGFIINRGNATTDDVLELIRLVRQTVKEKYAVELEPEVLFVGRR